MENFERRTNVFLDIRKTMEYLKTKLVAFTSSGCRKEKAKTSLTYGKKTNTNRLIWKFQWCHDLILFDFCFSFGGRNGNDEHAAHFYETSVDFLFFLMEILATIRRRVGNVFLINLRRRKSGSRPRLRGIKSGGVKFQFCRSRNAPETERLRTTINVP